MSTARYDVVGIGNAIVDVIARAEEDFLLGHGMHKGGMQLIDEARGLIGGDENFREGRAVFGFAAWTAQSEFGVSANERERGAQIVGSVGGELGDA